ncbi:MAG TPA: hypothetical protein VLT89_00950 [Usitatibacter sp.]|nr:hypothetical protein [Usitatibacter sp.]
MSNTLKEETGRVLFAGATVWGTVVAAGAAEGLYAKFDAGSVAAFAGAVSVYALAVYKLDPNLRAFAIAAGTRWVYAALGLLLALLGASGFAGLPALAVFSAPLAAAALAAAFDCAAGEKPRKSRAKSPGATRAAT